MDILDTPDGFILVLNRREPELEVGENLPELTFTHLLKVSSDGAILWRIAISARAPGTGQGAVPWRTEGRSVVRAKDGDGFLLTGVAVPFRRATKKDIRLFACKVDDCGFLVWIKTYADSDGESAIGYSIAALETTPGDPPRYMIAAQEAPGTTSYTTPGPAWVLVIDDDGNVIGNGVRHHGLETVVLSRLRVLPTYGPVLVGQTYKDQFTTRKPFPAWMLRVSSTGAPVSETLYSARSLCNYGNPVLSFLDVAEGVRHVMAVGSQYGAVRNTGVGTYMLLDGVPGPEGRTGAPIMARVLDDVEKLFGVQARSLEDDAGNRFRHFVVTSWDGWLARLSETGTLIWEKAYKAIGSSTWYAFLRSVAWRSNGDVVAGGFFLPGTSIPGFRGGTAPLVCSESEPSVAATPSCSTPTHVHQTEMEVTSTPGPMVADSFSVVVQSWTAAVEANGVITIFCRQGDPPQLQVGMLAR
ncbi:hypothetical protein WME91_33600 [Sorangium sp. So ce269]